ncbi:hypothetical protein D9758_004521 [Tetrapyrgos nigripes]|uniref:Xylanolytic transcriptional activator regulatory domain-containing protein n=1 Tax=Tetrapyrgos nigripes TaxID=182062 RepID=A0A8H5GZT6_9AGAR|nr:hypothetical protein D9758_004521 [Tetrapyrgos nigripes]
MTAKAQNVWSQFGLLSRPGSALHSREPSVSAPSRPPSAQRLGDVPIQVRQTLLNTFVPYSADLGFFLDFSEFCNSVVSSSPTYPVTPALMYTVFLIACRLSHSSQLSALEPGLLSRAVASTAQVLSVTSTSPGEHSGVKVLQAIQSHVLLAQYFFLTGRKLEGKYSVTLAVSLVLGTRMHRIRSEEEFSRGQALHPSGYTGYSGGPGFPPPQTPKEESQRVNAFWTVLALNSRWTAIEGTSTSLAYWMSAMRVDTPWPWVRLGPSTRNSSTIQKFLANAPDNGNSPMASHSKACILLEQAFELENRVAEGSTSGQQFLSVFNNLAVLTARFITELPSIESIQESTESESGSPGNGSSRKRALLVIHTLARVALIKLYSLYEATNPSSSSERARAQQFQLEAAKEAARMIAMVDLRRAAFVDPIMAILWRIIAQVLSAQEARGRVQAEIQSYVDLVMQAMSMLAPRSSLMSDQLVKLQGSSR